MNINRYFNRIHNIISSRRYIEIEKLNFDHSGNDAQVKGRLLFYDQSLLEFNEVLWCDEQNVSVSRYSYHYQDRDENLIFRYDNAPHFREIVTYPHHKHVGDDDRVESAQEPTLDDVLREIGQLIFNGESDGEKNWD